ncbi:MAG: tetratricopeptide repeat protein [Steroidobacteraceae bacterium]
MSARLHYIATLSFLAVAAEAGAACPRGDSWKLTIEAERSIARAEWPRAAELYGCAAHSSDDVALAERATRTAFDHHQLEQSVASARRWLELAPTSEVARRYLATGLLRQYDHEAAAEQFAELLKTSYPDRARGYMTLLGILAEEENDSGAARVIEMLAASDPELPEAHYAASALWQRSENGSKALAAAERATGLRRDWRQAELARVRALAIMGRTEDALKESAALAADGDLFTRISHAWLLVGNDQLDEAAGLFEALRKGGGAVAGDALAGLAAIAIDRKRFDEAIALVNEAARDPEQAETAQWNLGRIAEERGESANAALRYQDITAGPRAATAQLRAYRLWRELGAQERAELLIDDLLASSPAATRDAVAGVAAILAEEGRGEDAIALVDRALGFLPDDSMLLARGFLLERLDRVPEAIKDMRAVVARRPDDPMAQNALGYTLVDRTKSIKEGRLLIERALAAKPDSYAIQDSMGWALVRSGELEEGRTWLQNAWDRSEDPEVAAHLGETFWLMGREDDARRIWDEALAANPESRPLLKAIERHPR